MPWDPGRYLQFQNERFAPFEDLAALIERREGLRVIDLGCGTGELTERLADLLPGSEILGIDSSPEMLQRASQHERPGLHFQLGRLEDLEGTYDLIFSHAVLQWVERHRELMPFLIGHLAPRGQLAIQMPSNHHHPSHVLIAQTAAEEPFRAALGGWSRESPVLRLDAYAEILYAAGIRKMRVMEKVYPHVLESADAIADWTSGTALVPYFERLPADLREAFIERYRARLRARFPHHPVFYGFRRILLAAERE